MISWAEIMLVFSMDFQAHDAPHDQNHKVKCNLGDLTLVSDMD